MSHLGGGEAGPLVTIMIPTYGQAAILHTAIESALSQSYSNLEVVVSDDASPDDTEATVRRYASDPRLRYVRRGTNLGRVRNYRTTLVQDARGEFALNLDGDDWLCDDRYVADAMALVAASPDLALVFGRSKSYREEAGLLEDEATNRGLPPVCDGSDLFLRYADGDVSIAHMTALYRREIAVSLGFYEHDVIGSDSVALLLLLPGRKIGFVDRPVGVWRRHASNATWSSDLTSRRANFVVADVPALAAREAGAIDAQSLGAWRRKMSARLGHQAMADSIAHGRPGSAALLLMDMLRDRPLAALGALARLASHGGKRLLRAGRG